MRRPARAIKKMALRSGEDIPFIWIRISLSGVDVNNLRDRVQQKLQSHPKLVNAQPSINMNVLGTEALVKVNADQAWVDSLPAGIRNKIIKVYTEADQREAVTLVKALGWGG